MESLEAKIDLLLEQTKKLTEKLQPSKQTLRSASVTELVTALALAQKDYKKVTADNDNEFVHIAFASLTQATDATREALCKNGISVIQPDYDHEDGTYVIHTIMFHNSGEFIESRARVNPATSDLVAITSYINWKKRIAYANMVGYPMPGEDDDGANYSETTSELPTGAVGSKRTKLAYAPISAFQREELIEELKGFGELHQQILDWYGLQNIADLKKEKYGTVILKIRELKLQMKKKNIKEA